MTKYVRFHKGQTTAYGIVEGGMVRQLDGDLFGTWYKTEKTYPLKVVKLLVPTRPTKVLALAGNYLTHLGSEDPRPEHPEAFFKVPSCLIAQGENVVIPKHTSVVHLEAEMVVVIGKRAKNVPESESLKYVLGITCGNDISARDWQSNDRQWWRAKGTDTFGPCGPYIVSGINYDNLLLQSRLNGEVKQSQRTSDMIFNVSEIVSWISRHVTLEPGDLIYTGTPGKTPAIKPGDLLEIELEGVGVLKNPVVAEP
ncbi:MAG: fumarylacetoacetate hydrolase family protein [Planctomycetota bacterium]|nr:MAG: fumarylacetoacetate hydrolase family protein [Planctomycetota bacterium]